MRIIRFLFLATLLTVAWSASAWSQVTKVPFRTTERGLILVDVQINGKGPFTFLIDTGATTSVVFAPLAQQLDLPRNGNGYAVVHGIVESGEHPLSRLSSLEIGDTKLDAVGAIILQSPSVKREWQGIIGLNVLSDFIFVFDNDEKTIALYDTETSTRRLFSGWRKLPVYHDETLKRSFKLLFVPVRVDGVKIDALIDLGSTTLILNWPGARRIGLDRMYRQLEEKWLIEGATGEFKPRTIIRDAEIRIGRLEAKGSLLVVDSKALRELNREETPFLILNAALFSKGSFAVDVNTPAFYLKPRPSLPSLFGG